VKVSVALGGELLAMSTAGPVNGALAESSDAGGAIGSLALSCPLAAGWSGDSSAVSSGSWDVDAG
jgi:hypothetical protein